MARGTDDPSRGWLRALLRYCRAHPVLFGIALAGALGAALASTAAPLVIRYAVDDLLTGRRHSVWPAATVLIGLAALQYALHYTLQLASAKLGLQVQYALRRDLFTTLSRLPGAEQDRLDTGQVVSRSVTDLGVISGVITFLPDVFSTLVMFVVALLAMAVLSPLLTLVALAIAPAFWLVSRAARTRLFPADWAASQVAGELVGHVDAAVTGVRVVKGFGQEERELDLIAAQSSWLFANRLRAIRLQARYAPVLTALPSLGQIGVLLLGGWLAINGHITLGTFLAFSAYLGKLIVPVRVLSELLTVGPQAGAGITRVLELIDLPVVAADVEGAVVLPDAPPSVEFDRVSFGYGAGPVLDGLSFTVAAGETVALVGASGSGKSTVLALLSRFYEPGAGTIRVGGVPLERLTRSGLRARTGVVAEDSSLFSDSVRDTIAFGHPRASTAQVQHAARLAEADEFIQRLPAGYDTVIGERGQSLSGGQRQRLALARALLVEPRLLLLDDATSAVDPRIETRILSHLRDSGAPRTTVLVAHRRSSVELADRVVLLDAGRVVAQGTAAQLRASSPLFRRLFYPEGLDEETAEVAGLSGLTSSDGAAETLRATALVSGGAAAGAATRTGGIAGVTARSDRLLALVAALPPAVGSPDVDEALVRAPEPSLGLRSLLRPVRSVVLLGLILTAGETVAGLLLPSVVRSGVDSGVARASMATLTALSLLALLILLGQWALGRAAQLVTGRTGERLLYLLRVKTFAHLQRLGLDFYERELSGRIMTRMTTDIDALSTFLQSELIVLFVSSLTLVGVAVALVIVNASLTLVLLAMFPAVVIATILFRWRVIPTYARTRESLATLNAYLQENVAGLRTVQAFNRQEHNLSRFLELARSAFEARYRGRRAVAAYFPFITFASQVSEALVLGFGAAELRNGTLTAGALIAFFLYLEIFFGPMADLSSVFDGYQQAAVGLARLRELLQTPTSTPEAQQPLTVTGLVGTITFSGVEFAYPGTVRPALSGLDLTIAAGETVAFVGETGAGKSTIVKLLTRFYDPTAGSVSVDGHDLRTLELTGYRRRIGLVPQEQYLSAGTVASAIAYGRPDASRGQIEAAARRVGADQAIRALADGYDHPVAERGRNLSAGQRQLLALARAELVEPDVLVLDEATASLDLATEAAVARATRALTARRTTIIVAHRLATAARADRLYVIADGQVAETGTHESLLAADGVYAELWASYSDRPIEGSVIG
ncbi:ABC transporter ATP-binding protein/permease [Jatrophihabitans telluris]|uniref:ABC transporter ATP-binding protein/permease n=1 Tax=Jatrophihabitans telluris TaxID=2038343 RepID=A0ABY4QXQ8_9ACTN|nr:ABC transporter ATP-binding protein [Jatrophihabitans telluris]UQX87675.1 ABC transporter ATP-binding protein/permease [Jatrophihabitans telluris]